MRVDDAERIAANDKAPSTLAGRVRYGAVEAGHLCFGGARTAIASALPVLLVAVVVAGATAWLMPAGYWRWGAVPLVLLVGALLAVGVLAQTFWVGMVAVAVRRYNAAGTLCDLLLRRIASDPSAALGSVADLEREMRAAAADFEQTWEHRGGLQRWMMSVAFRRLASIIESLTLGMVRADADAPIDAEHLRQRLVGRVDQYVQDRLTDYTRGIQRGAIIALITLIAIPVAVIRYGVKPAA